jgi:TP901 family phage tail tape measure protein
MYEIDQHLGFEVADALKALDDLDRKFATFGSRLDTTVSQIQSFNTKASSMLTLMQQLSTQANSMAAAFGSIRAPSDDLLTGKVFRGGQTTGLTGGAAAKQMEDWIAGCQKAGGMAQATEEALNRLGQNGTKSVQSVTLSWQTFARVAQTQALIRGFNLLRNTVEESFTSFEAFSKQVGEIAAINPERRFDEIAASVRQMSDAFNQPLNRTAEAQYQTISDQFIRTTDVTNIMTAANKLAKAGAQDLAASSQLLTGALNAYGESSDKAALRAAEFFETIKLGRLRASELGTALGRVQGIAHELGVSIEELNASLVSITIGGVKSNEAATQLRGIMSSLLKPSDELKKAFNAIGVESGTQAIATYGFQGTLNALWKAIDGNKAAAAALFPNVRAMAGDFRLAGEGARAFNEAMEVQTKLDRESLNKPYEAFRATDSERLNTELNKLKNFFTTEFGAKLVAQLNDVVQAIGGGNGILGALRVLTSETPRDIALVGALALAFKGLALGATQARQGFALLDLSVKANSASITRYFGTLKGVLGMLAAIETAKVAGTSLGNWYADRLAAPQEAIQAKATRELEIEKTKSDAAIRLAENTAAKQFQILRQSVAEASREYLRDTNNFKARAAEIEHATQKSFDTVLSSRQKLTRDLFTASEAAAKNAATVPDTIEKLSRDVEERRFRSETAAIGDPIEAYVARLQNLIEEYQTLQGTAKDDREQKLADDAWQRVQAYKELIQAQVKMLGGEDSLVRVAQLEDDLTQRKIEALAEYERTQKQVATEAEARAHTAETHNAELEKLRLKIQNELKATAKDTEGNVSFKDTTKYKADLAAAAADTQEFLRLVKEYGADFSAEFLGDPRAFEAMTREAERALASAHLQTIEVAPEALGNLRNQLKNSIAGLRAEIPAIARLEKLTGENVLQVGVDKVLTDAASKFQASLTKSVQYTTDVKSRELARSEYAQGRATFAPLYEGANTASGEEWGKVDTAFRTAEKLSQTVNVTRDQVEALKASLNSIDWGQVFSGTDTIRAKSAMQTMLSALDTMARHAAVPPPKSEETEAQEIQIILNGLERRKQAEEEAKKATQGATTAAVDLSSALSRVANTDLSQLLWQLTSINRAMSNTAMPAAAERLETAMFGGHFATGGRGTDTQMAMLSKGKFVLNAESTRKWASQAIAMNAGVQPVFHNVGGNVTNVGDINVTVSGGGSSHQTARSIAAALKRELRKGTSTL